MPSVLHFGHSSLVASFSPHPVHSLAIVEVMIDDGDDYIDTSMSSQSDSFNILREIDVSRVTFLATR